MVFVYRIKDHLFSATSLPFNTSCIEGLGPQASTNLITKNYIIMNIKELCACENLQSFFLLFLPVQDVLACRSRKDYFLNYFLCYTVCGNLRKYHGRILKLVALFYLLLIFSSRICILHQLALLAEPFGVVSPNCSPQSSHFKC